VFYEAHVGCPFSRGGPLVNLLPETPAGALVSPLYRSGPSRSHALPQQGLGDVVLRTPACPASRRARASISSPLITTR
jgi:hypothetical protein